MVILAGGRPSMLSAGISIGGSQAPDLSSLWLSRSGSGYEELEIETNLHILPTTANAGVYHIFRARQRPAVDVEVENKPVSTDDLAAGHRASGMRLPGIALC